MRNKIAEGQVSLFDLVEYQSNSSNENHNNYLESGIYNSEDNLAFNISPVLSEETEEQNDFILKDNVNVDISISNTDVNTKNDCCLDLSNFSNYSMDIKLPLFNERFISLLNEKQLPIIEKYKDSCIRIVQKSHGAILVELPNETLYYNANGVLEFSICTSTPLLPSDKILVVNEDKEINDLQMKILNSLNVSRYIKRVGDANIIVVSENTKVINPKGWLLDYTQVPCYDSNSEVYIVNSYSSEKELLVENENDFDSNIMEPKIENGSIDNDLENNENEEETQFYVGEKVISTYDNKTIVGVVKSVYNGGSTVNIEWDGKCSAFFFKNVSKFL